VVLSRAAIHAAGPYACPNVRIRAKAVATNTPPNGAFRGFGAPQSLFAAELMVEHVAERLGISSVDLRRMWMLRLGDTTATGQKLTESVGSELVLDAALRAAPPVQPSNHPSVRRGRGLSLVFHGSGFTGSGERSSRARSGSRRCPTARSESSPRRRRSGREPRRFSASSRPKLSGCRSSV
jgi:CO/xanthine dehydrogenase Mo-binding subunit